MKINFVFDSLSGQSCSYARRKFLILACLFTSLSTNTLAKEDVVLAPIIGLLSDGNLCVNEAVEAVRRPVDLIFVIDNSASMSGEISSFESAINTELYIPLQDSGLDNQVVMLTNHGSGSYEVCVGPPLSGTTNCAGAPVAVANQFYHYDVDVQSHDALCILSDTLYGSNSGGEPDEWGFYPNGWVTILRQEALKIIVPITDDGVSCSWNGNTYDDGDAVNAGQQVAVDWDQDFLPLAPNQFGNNANRNYVMHPFVAIEEKASAEPYEWFEGITTAVCASGAIATGTGYQWLAKGTHGLRFPTCSTSNYGAYMNTLVEDTLTKATNRCQYPIPQPQGQTIDPENIRLIFLPAIGEPVTLLPVEEEKACGVSTTSFYISGDIMHLCPNTCAQITGDPVEAMQVEALCR